MQNFTTEFTVEQTPEQAFAAIVDVRGWWSGEIEGATDQLDAEFTYRYQNIHRSRQRITELAPGRRVFFNDTATTEIYTDDPSELGFRSS